jgi:type IV pilus assembly protein PilX
MNRHCHRRSTLAHQKGMALFTALVFLLMLTLIGVTVARMQTAEESMARNDHNHLLAVQAAEAALRDAEQGLNVNSCADYSGANANGQYQLQADNGSILDTFNWSSHAASDVMAYAGPPLTDLPANSRNPEYLVENLPPAALPMDGSISMQSYGNATVRVAVCRITAHALGGDRTAQATLQSVYH